MIKLILTLIVCTALFTSCSRTGAGSLIREYKSQNEAIAFTCPGWLASIALHVATKNNPELRSTLHDMELQIGKIRILHSEKSAKPIAASHIQKKLGGKYDLLTMIKSEDAHVQIWSPDEGEYLKKLFLYIQTEEETMMLEVNGNINLSKILSNKDTKTRILPPKVRSKGA